MKLTVITATFQVSFKIEELNHRGNEFFTFKADIEDSLFDFLETSNLIYKQHTGSFTIKRGVEFQVS